MQSDFPTRFRAERLRQGLTLAQAAAKCGVSKRLVSYWEAGEKVPPTEKLACTDESMMRALGTKSLATEDGRTLRFD